MTNRFPAVAGAVGGAVAVALGAFGAHALRPFLNDDALRIWHTAVDYQFWHALALITATFAPPSRWRVASIAAFLAGMTAFCTSLYALALGAPRWIGMVTPFGGVALIAGWLCLGAAFWRTAK